MLRWFCLFVCAYMLFGAVAHADTVTLRPRVEANGTAITLGDIFDGAGAVGSRAIAPAPPPGQIATLTLPVLQAAASAAGLEWTPPAGLTSVQVVRPGGARATLPPAAGGVQRADLAVRRGQSVTLLYQTPGMRISTSARALEDAGVGESVRLVNLSSNRTINAMVTGPGAAVTE